MNVNELISVLGAECFTGVPDSKLRPLVDYLMDTYGANSPAHLIAANEGSAAALAVGCHLATGKVPLVYLQNSGLGNLVNPLLSLLHREVYGIPCIFVIGWRGEPDLHDEPQHLVQGRLSLPLLETMGVRTMVLTRDSTPAEVAAWMATMHPHLKEGGQCALLVRDGALDYPKRKYANAYTLRREDAIAQILDAAGNASSSQQRARRGASCSSCGRNAARGTRMTSSPSARWGMPLPLRSALPCTVRSDA